jgi:hypothetical protein
MRNVLDKFVEKIKTNTLCSITFFRKWHLLLEDVGKYGAAREATDDNILGRRRTACWITTVTDMYSEYVNIY